MDEGTKQAMIHLHRLTSRSLKAEQQQKITLLGMTSES